MAGVRFTSISCQMTWEKTNHAGKVLVELLVWLIVPTSRAQAALSVQSSNAISTALMPLKNNDAQMTASKSGAMSHGFGSVTTTGRRLSAKVLENLKAMRGLLAGGALSVGRPAH